MYRTNLAALFLNLEAIYLCINSFNDVSCKLFPSEDDGFRGGQAIFEASDNERNFQIFSEDASTVTYVLAVEGCRELTLSCLKIPQGIRWTLLLYAFYPAVDVLMVRSIILC